MAGYKSTFAYKLIYIMRISDKEHKGLLKIGEATLDSTLGPSQLPPCCDALNAAAHSRIKEYTHTAMVQYDLLHTELAIQKIEMDDGSSILKSFSDKDVAFLDLIVTDSADSNYPFSNEEYRNMFRHTFWIVPGVKEARALSKLLRKHPVFSQFEIANVAGEGDEEEPYDEALKKVQDTIARSKYTITLSCGRLTTGVTVPEWSAVMMLTGGANASASGYMQTIFRVQSAGSIGIKLLLQTAAETRGLIQLMSMRLRAN